MGMKRLFALVVALMTLGLGALWAYETGRTYQIAVGAGPRSGQAYKLMTALQEVVKRHHPEIKLEIYETRGSLENSILMARGAIQFATTQSDLANAPEARMVAELYPDTFQLIARPDAGIKSIGDLAGKRLALPPEKSGEFKSFWFLAAHYGLKPDDVEVVTGTETTTEWVFLNGDVDALFRIRAPGDETLLRLIDKVNGHILPIRQASALQLRQPALRAGVLPVGSYRGRPPVPAVDLPTVAVKLLLAVREEVPDNVVRAITSLLFERRRELISYEPLAGAITEPKRAAGTFLPLHPGARSFYDRDQPSFLQENAEPIMLIVSVAVVLGSILVQFASYRRKKAMDRYNSELMRLADKARRADDLDTIDRCDAELSDFVPRIIAATQSGQISSEQFDLFHFAYDAVEDAIRDRETQLSRAKPSLQPEKPRRASRRPVKGGMSV